MKPISPCTFTPIAAARPIFRGFERLLGQDILANAIKLEGNFLGAGASLQSTRDGNPNILAGGNLDPKGLFVDIPTSIAKGTRILPSVSFTGQKLLARGNLYENRRTNLLSGTAATFGGSYTLAAGLDISNPTSSSDRTYIANLGV